LHKKTQKQKPKKLTFMLLFFWLIFLFIRVFKTAACYKMTYDVFNLHITQLLYLLADITVLHTCMYV
jgi:hypothetical protein